MLVRQLVYILTGIVAFGAPQVKGSATDVSRNNTQPTSLVDHNGTAVCRITIVRVMRPAHALVAYGPIWKRVSTTSHVQCYLSSTF